MMILLIEVNPETGEAEGFETDDVLDTIFELHSLGTDFALTHSQVTQKEDGGNDIVVELVKITTSTHIYHFEDGEATTTEERPSKNET